MTHQTYAIRITPSGGSATFIHAIGRQTADNESEVNSDVDAGSPYPQSVTINAQKQRVTSSTKDISAALALLGTEGKALTGAGFEFWQLLLDDDTGLHDTGSVHRKLNVPSGKVVPGRLTCEHQRDAVLDLMTHATFNGTDDPILDLASQALPAGLSGDERYTLHSASIGGVDLDCSLRYEIDFGIRLETEGCNSDIWDTSVVITEIKPTVTISGKNIERFAGAGAIPLVGKAGTHADTEINLRRRSQDIAGFTSLAATNHMRFTADCLAHWEQVHDSDRNGRVENQLKLECRHDGTNLPLVALTGIALSV